MKITLDWVFKITLVFLFLMGIQFSPEFSLIPYSSFFRLVLIFIFLLSVLYASKCKLLNLSDSSISLISIIFLFYMWALITAVVEGQYVFESARRSTLAIGISLLILMSFLFYKPSANVIGKVLLMFLVLATIVSFFSLLLSFMGGGYTSTGTGQYYQSWRLLGFEFKHVVHFAGGFPRISGITSNPNSLGFYSGLGCVLAVSFYLLKQIGMLKILPLFLINLSSLIHTFSRAAMLALFFSSIIVLLFSSRKRFIVAISISIFIGFIAVVVFGETILSFIASRSEQGLSGRDRIWAAAFNSFLSNPIFGVGFGLEMENIMDPAGIRWSMHNAYLAVLAETGLVGFGIFLLFVFSIFKMICYKILYSSLEKERFVLITIFIVLVFLSTRSLFETAIFRFTYINMIYIFFIGSAVSMSVSKNKI